MLISSQETIFLDTDAAAISVIDSFDNRPYSILTRPKSIKDFIAKHQAYIKNNAVEVDLNYNNNLTTVENWYKFEEAILLSGLVNSLLIYIQDTSVKTSWPLLIGFVLNNRSRYLMADSLGI